VPGPIADRLLAVAREAFTQGLQVAALTSAAIAASMAVLIVVLLRRARTAPPLEEQLARTPDEAVEPARP
jgi:DHA2 family multidrug resistance protein-like MFS transporter